MTKIEDNQSKLKFGLFSSTICIKTGERNKAFLLAILSLLRDNWSRAEIA